MKKWCKYCHMVTPAAPARPGRPRDCAICLHPYDEGEPVVPPPANEGNPKAETSQPAASAASTATAATVPLGPCLYLRERNNSRTFKPKPHRRNACYARFRLEQSWWRPTPVTMPMPVSTEHQARFCFADYTHCPYFLPPGTPPRLIRGDEAVTPS